MILKDNPVFSNNQVIYLKILDNWVFKNLISIDKLFAKALRIFTTCLLANNNLWGKLVSFSPIMFDDNLDTTSVSFFITDLNLLSCEFDSYIIW